MLPNFDQFKKDINAIYPSGDMVAAYALLKELSTREPELQKDEFYHDILLAKFRDHVEAWKRKYGERDEKYVPESAHKELKNIRDFMAAYMWRQEFKGLSQVKSRDKYLFPNKPTDELISSLKRFKERL